MANPPPLKRRRVEEISTCHLPSDMLMEIALRVTTASALLNMLKVSKDWNELLKQSEEEIWKHFVTRDFPKKRMSSCDISFRELYFKRLREFVISMELCVRGCHGYYCVDRGTVRVSLKSMDEHLRFNIHRQITTVPWLCRDKELNIKVMPSSMRTYGECTLKEIIMWFLVECAPRARCDYTFHGHDGTVRIGIDWEMRRSPDFSHTSSC